MGQEKKAQHQEEEEVSKEWVVDYLKRLVSAAGLYDWRIGIEFGDEPRPRQATVETYPEYRRAHIVFMLDNVDDIDEAKLVLAHEVVHILLSPMTRMWEIIHEEKDKRALLMYAAEQVMSNLEVAGLIEDLVRRADDANG